MLKNIITKYKKYLITLIIVLLSIVSIIMQENHRNESININSETIIKDENKIAVYITGAVKNPGVYYLDIGCRLSNLLDVCGGVLDNADINQINLAKRLSDSDKIDIPFIKEDIEEEETEEDKVNINTADESELMTLNGIGESTARKIIEYRKIQEFVQIEDIMDVPGIGESKYNNIKNNICI
ncbi:MAG: ComEA family DNA-binding protein [Clostridia bacterium]|nr:ComEA family DNA-binding protein [Clostridia bacterium]